jgi:hypothetical protein
MDTTDDPAGRSRQANLGLVGAVVVLALVVVGLLVLLVRQDEDDGDTASTTSVAVTTAPTTALPTTTSTTVPPPTTTPAPSPEDGRFPGFVTRAFVAADGTPHAELDYVLFYTGDEAHAQAAARGTEAPNDIFIVNDNPRLRDFVIEPATTVQIVCFDGDEGCTPTASGGLSSITYAVDDWIAQTGLLAETDLFGRSSDLFWVTIADNRIVAIEEQYLP